MEEALYQLRVTLDWVHIEALRAYWHNRLDCGSDFVEDGHCLDCEHFAMCQATSRVRAGLEALSQMVGD